MEAYKGYGLNIFPAGFNAGFVGVAVLNGVSRGTATAQTWQAVTEALKAIVDAFDSGAVTSAAPGTYSAGGTLTAQGTIPWVDAAGNPYHLLVRVDDP